jgi:hypothetical protein
MLCVKAVPCDSSSNNHVVTHSMDNRMSLFMVFLLWFWG